MFTYQGYRDFLEQKIEILKRNRMSNFYRKSNTIRKPGERETRWVGKLDASYWLPHS